VRRLAVRRRSDALLAVVDALTAALVALVAYRLRFEGDATSDRLTVRYQAVGLALVVAWPVAGRAAGLYRRGALRPGTSLLEPASEAAGVVGVALLVVNAVGLSGDLSRAWVGLVVLGLVLVGIGVRRVLRRGRRLLVPLGIGLERYAVVGEPVASRRLVGDLTRAPGAPYRVVAELSGDLAPVDLVMQARALHVDGLVLTPGADPRWAGGLAAELAGSGIDVLLAPSLGELELRVASIAVLHGVPLLRVAGLAPRRKAVRVPPRDRGRRGVAVLGTRGIPASYGGFETFAQELAVRLAAEGVPTVVYCRKAYSSGQPTFRGVRLVTLPTLRTKHLETVVHTALSAAHLVLSGGPRDVVLCNAANAPVLLLLKLFRRRVVLNVDGLEWRRAKWGVAGRSWYRLGEWLSVRLAAVLVTDAEEVRTYYRVRHDTESVMVPYGAEQLARASLPLPPDLAVEPDGYVLYVSRWERENNPLMVVEAHALAPDVPLVLLGTATYDDELSREVHAAAGPSVRLPGAVYGDGYRALQAAALGYVHATEVGGTHPALIEALAAGNVCLVLDTPENREVAAPGGAVFFQDRDGLAAALRQLAAMPATELAPRRARAREHAARTYSWTVVTDRYADLLGIRPQP